MANYYVWFKALHVISIIAWMAGLLYLPRLYVYHTKAAPGSELDKTLQTMERRLLRIIMNPAMILSYIFGLINAYIYSLSALGVWFHIKFTCVLLLSAIHAMLAKYRRDFASGKNIHSENFYRLLNEVPAVLMIIIVIMVIVKPFE